MLPFDSSDLPAVLLGKLNCCLILLQMRFTSHNCYQLCGSLLHCLFTLTISGGIFSVALSVKHWTMQKTTVTIVCPVIIRHFFRRSPDFISFCRIIINYAKRGYIPSELFTKLTVY